MQLQQAVVVVEADEGRRRYDSISAGVADQIAPAIGSR